MQTCAAIVFSISKKVIFLSFDCENLQGFYLKSSALIYIFEMLRFLHSTEKSTNFFLMFRYDDANRKTGVLEINI